MAICPKCEKSIAWYELYRISWRKVKCNHCGAISFFSNLGATTIRLIACAIIAVIFADLLFFVLVRYLPYSIVTPIGVGIVGMATLLYLNNRRAWRKAKIEIRDKNRISQ